MADSTAAALVASRYARDDARERFDARLAQVKADLAARGVAGRAADKLGGEAKAMLDDALDLASESKGVIAGTIAALTLWFLRHPILAWIEGLRDDLEEKLDD